MECQSLTSQANKYKGRNTGVKAFFGGSVKKPLMTKVSMRHLNEIVRERNQNSRNTYEAWQDYINLKARMDSDISKLTKRNNFLIEEAESWKSQLVKIQAMWEQLNKESQELKVKIEAGKRENRRINSLLDQNKNESQRLTARLQKSEKLREEAIDALMLQQELAETLEREREKNLKEISSLKQTNKSVHRQKEEAQRVVVHLRSLITGQTRHMEHIVGSLYAPSEIAEIADHDETQDDSDGRRSVASDRSQSRTSNRLSTSRSMNSIRRMSRRPYSIAENADAEKVSQDTESRAANSPRSKRLSEGSLLDIADRHLRDKTDAISHIIRNISEQCSAAVEALQLAQAADQESGFESYEDPTGTDNHTGNHSEANSETDYNDASSAITGISKHSSIPPTPDLYRSSTSLSMNSLSTANDRSSQQFSTSSLHPKIIEGDEAEENGSISSAQEVVTSGKGKTPERHALAPGQVRVVS